MVVFPLPTQPRNTVRLMSLLSSFIVTLITDALWICYIRTVRASSDLTLHTLYPGQPTTEPPTDEHDEYSSADYESGTPPEDDTTEPIINPTTASSITIGDVHGLHILGRL